MSPTRWTDASAIIFLLKQPAIEVDQVKCTAVSILQLWAMKEQVTHSFSTAEGLCNLIIHTSIHFPLFPCEILEDLSE